MANRESMSVAVNELYAQVQVFDSTWFRWEEMAADDARSQLAEIEKTLALLRSKFEVVQ